MLVFNTSCLNNNPRDVNCELNPNHESCVVDCDSNPNHESCVIDCDSNPDHESCVVDCDLNPDHESCNNDDLCVAIDIRYPNYLKDLKISDFELSKIEVVDDYLVKPATYSEIIIDQSTILFDVQSILDSLGTVNRSIGPPLGENELLRLYFTSDYYDFQVNFYKNGTIDGYRAVEIVNLECGDLSYIFVSGYFESELNSIYDSVQEYMP